MAASNTRFTQNSLGQSKTPIDSDHGIYRYRRVATLQFDTAPDQQLSWEECLLSPLFRPMSLFHDPIGSGRFADVGQWEL